MEATKYNWEEVAEDHPIALLTRHKIEGERMLVARIHLAKGCIVKEHHHESEQISIMLSGSVRWWIGKSGAPDHREMVMKPGDILVLPAHVPHGVETLEDSLLIDVLTPIGPMGVDSQRD